MQLSNIFKKRDNLHIKKICTDLQGSLNKNKNKKSTSFTGHYEIFIVYVTQSYLNINDQVNEFYFTTIVTSNHKHHLQNICITQASFS